MALSRRRSRRTPALAALVLAAAALPPGAARAEARGRAAPNSAPMAREEAWGLTGSAPAAVDEPRTLGLQWRMRRNLAHARLPFLIVAGAGGLARTACAAPPPPAPVAATYRCCRASP